MALLEIVWGRPTCSAKGRGAAIASWEMLTTTTKQLCSDQNKEQNDLIRTMYTNKQILFF